MLEGTDLMSAYQPLGSSTMFDNSSYAPLDDYNQQQEHPQQNENKVVKVQQQQIPQQQKQNSQQLQVQQPTPQQQVQYANDPRAGQELYNAGVFNKQYEQEIRIQNALNELKRRKEEPQQQYNNSPSYFDKLFGKKKELGKIMQFTLIIVLGLSIHYLIDHYLGNYISNHDMSFERQMFLRILYPVAILFILWNLKVFIK